MGQSEAVVEDGGVGGGEPGRGCERERETEGE